MEELSLSGRELYELVTGFFEDTVDCSMKIRCHGHSMSPFVKDGCNLILGQISTTPGVGEIVVAADRREKRILIHRVVAKTKDRYQLKGDNNSNTDGWFHRKDLLAVLEAVEDRMGRLKIGGKWQNRLIALASRTHLLERVVLPGLRMGRRLLVLCMGYIFPMSRGSRSSI